MRNSAGVQFTTLALVWLLAGHDASGAPTDAKSRAAELFEQGVRQFSSAQYEAAAQAFLGADELVPNPQALVNGITAARRAGLHLVVARASERALARQDMDPKGAAFAREALAEAARSLTLVEVTCEPTPCKITLDGAALAPGRQFIAPGIHDFVGASANGASATEHLSCEAGASYRVALAAKVPSAPASVAPPPPPPAKAPPPRPSPPPSRAVRAKPLSPAVFIGGAVGTGVLIALTTWSGVDALSAKSDYESGKQRSWTDVKDLARRTDFLLAGTIVLGAATAVAGLWFVEWGSGHRATAVVLPGGAALSAGGQF